MEFTQSSAQQNLYNINPYPSGEEKPKARATVRQTTLGNNFTD
jgi:hypothetical protein